jgi:hypothetical protein
MPEIWNIEEGSNFEWTGTWTKVSSRGGLEQFRCVQHIAGGSNLEADIKLLRSTDGKNFSAVKINVSPDGNECYYFGEINGNDVTGYYATIRDVGKFRFRATIARG